MSSDRNEFDGATPAPFEEDMGLFPPAAERAMRFMCSYTINVAITETKGPIQEVIIGAGFPWMAAMQANDHLKHCDSRARRVMRVLSPEIDSLNAPPELDTDTIPLRRALQSRPVRDYIRSALTAVMFEPPESVVDTEVDIQTRNMVLEAYLYNKFREADSVLRGVNEPPAKIYRGDGGWSTLVLETAPLPLLEELKTRLGPDKAEAALGALTKLVARHCKNLRPFKLSVLDTRSVDELMTQAELIYANHPEVTETAMYQKAVELAGTIIPQTNEHDLSAIDDGTATVIIPSHWPLRHQVTGNASDAGWAMLLSQLNRKLMTDGIAIFFPWETARAFDPHHPDVTLGGVRSMLINEYGFEVSEAADPTSDILKAVSVFGREAALLAPQMRGSGKIGRMIARKRRTLKNVLSKSSPAQPQPPLEQ